MSKVSPDVLSKITFLEMNLLDSGRRWMTKPNCHGNSLQDAIPGVMNSECLHVINGNKIPESEKKTTSKNHFGKGLIVRQYIFLRQVIENKYQTGTGMMVS